MPADGAASTPAGRGLSAELRRQAEQLVRPLYVGLDGAAGFDRVARLERHAAALAAGEGEEPTALLSLLLLFHGVVDRLGSLGAGGRLDLFLRGGGVGDELGRRLRAGLGRLGTPASPQAAREEALLHDAMLLEASGVAATAERLMAAGKRRLPLGRALAQLDPGAPAERYRTAAGRRLGAARREAAAAWIDDLRRRVRQEAQEDEREEAPQFTGMRPANPSS